MNVKTKEQFAKQFKKLYPTLTLLSDYTNSSSPIKVKCNICGKIFLKKIHINYQKIDSVLVFLLLVENNLLEII